MKLVDEDLPSALVGRVCIKRPYQNAGRSEVPQRKTEDCERRDILRKVNTILWATTIHDMSMNMVATTAPSCGHPPGPILDLAFVEAAVVLNMKPESGFTALVERKLPEQFKKYIGNASPEPIPGLDAEAHAKAVFLCFLQHVQFHFSLGKVFVSDYQVNLRFILPNLGAGPWLTDPQVIAKSEMNGKTLFSDGNFDGSLEEFQEKHQCLDWCQWFGLERLSDSDSD
ncbi:hypothetical protein IW261DRAFT_1422907 [Armillaria novae-zelandiae]|uniref:Alpha-type protein kinase domain-containing protein n=1 Tax=Armillaria novae-zelandiae TaxID=153914 RepID=A0AA39NZ81_9AGAR|nr:hypothetical protein IW261DRAFT_1422907 [Armillaria novae-zelandiae]